MLPVSLDCSIFLNRRQRKPKKGQSSMDNSEKQAALGQDTERRYTKEKKPTALKTKKMNNIYIDTIFA